MDFIRIESPCKGCEHIDTDKELNPACIDCEKIFYFRKVTDPEKEEPSKRMVDLNKKLDKIKKKPAKQKTELCAECRKVRCRIGETFCQKCKNKTLPCSKCGDIGIYSKKLCWPCYYAWTREKAA